MEKRTILAFALSFLVLILWSFLFNPSKDQVSKKGETPETVAPKTVSQSTETASAPKAALSKAPEKTKITLAPETDEKEVVVDTPLYRAVFTNAGPTIKSFKLKEYRESVEPDSPLIELINLQQDKADFLIISFDGAPASPLKKTIYQVEHQKIRLESNSSPKNLVFNSSTSGGISITQTYRFYPDQYRIELHIDVINQSGEIVTGAFVADIKALPPEGKQSYYSYVGIILLLDDKLEEVKIKKESEPKDLAGRIDWMAYEDDFFISAVIPEQPSKASFKGRLLPSGILEGTHMPPSISLHPS